MAKRKTRGGSSRNTVAAEPAPQALHAGSWQPFAPETITRVCQAALEILSDIGMADAPPEVIRLIEDFGGRLHQGRLLFPLGLLEQTIADCPRRVLLAGQDPRHDLKVGGRRAYTGTGGAAPLLLEASGAFRPSNLADLYDAARLADHLPHIHFFARSLVARDWSDPLDLDLATTAACLLGTTKHVMLQASAPEHLDAMLEICEHIAGPELPFRDRPVFSLNINHVVPPLRFDPQAARVLMRAVSLGIPVHCNVFGQLGASSSVTVSGSAAQTLAEALAGLALVHALQPSAPRIAGPRAMITDLRSGAMAGGSGEQVQVNALLFQAMRSWDLPCSAIAGATDSKRPDFQAGYEKAVTINSAVQAGANLVTQAAGSQAGLMAASLAAMAADNDMLGVIARANAISGISDDAPDLEAIREVTAGEGHFLARPETYARMRSDFLYPHLADRSSLDAWQDGPQLDMAARAEAETSRILAQHWPSHGSEAARRALCQRFQLPSSPSDRPTC